MDEIRFDYVTLVSRCPYCGAGFDQPGVMRDGRPCTHPTKMRFGFNAVGAQQKETPRMTTNSPKLNPEQIARVAHEANRAYCLALGDTSHAPWDEAPAWQKDSAIQGVLRHLETGSLSPEAAHEGWCEQKRRDGWSFGLVKDATLKTHPCLVSWDQLPDYQRKKDELYCAIIATLT